MSDLVVTLTVDQLAALVRQQVDQALAARANVPQQPARCLTSEEAGAHLGIPAHMVRKRAREGEIECFYIGTSMRFEMAALQAFKAANRKPPGKKAA
jgi:excisionase family DNA binding protein